jgi:two-component system, sensor histidine kinase YesM
MRLKFTNLKIKHKIFVFLLIVAFITSSLGIIFIQITQSLYNELVYQQNAEKFHLISRQIEEKLTTIDKLSLAIMSDSGVQRYLSIMKSSPGTYEAYTAARELQLKLMSYQLFDYSISSVAILDANSGYLGVGLNVNQVDAAELITFKEEAALRKGASVWMGRNLGAASFVSLREIREVNDTSMEPLGTLIIQTSADKLMQTYSYPARDRNSTMLIVDNQNVIYPAETQIQYQELQLISDQAYSVITVNEEKHLAAHFELAYTGWTFIHLVPYGSIFQGIIVMKIALIVIYALIVLVILFIGLRFSMSITSPIDKLTKKMGIVEKGDLNLWERESPVNRDEIGQLSRNFDKMVERLDMLIRENYVNQIMLKDAEYNTLKAKLNPHFLYNTLDSINWLARLNGQQEISGMVKALGNLLRSTVNDKEFVTIEEEIDNLFHYIFIQKFRFEERLVYRMEIPEHLGALYIPCIILQPVVENSIKYGVESGTDMCEVVVSAKEDENHLVIQVKDTGPGMDMDYLEKLERGEVAAEGTGIGLKNIHDRLQNLFGEEYGIRIESVAGRGTLISIHLPKLNTI